MCVLKFLLCFKESKEKKEWMKIEEYGENKEVGNIEEKVFVIFVVFLK